MSGHTRAADLGQPQKGVSFDGRFLSFSSGTPANNISGFGKGALAIDKASGILYINQGNSTFANWIKVQGGAYMSDIADAAPVMYGERARVLVVGDSIHNPTQMITDTPSYDGYLGVVNAYHKYWRPSKWAGHCPILSASGFQSGFYNNFAGITDINVKMGTDIVGVGTGKYNIIQPTVFTNGFTGVPNGTSSFAPFNATATVSATNIDFPDENGDILEWQFGWTDPENQGFSVGRNQVFDSSSGGVNSERWYNAVNTTWTNKTLWYRDTTTGGINYGTDLNATSSTFHGASGTTTGNFTLSGNFYTTELTTQNIDQDILGTSAYFRYAAASGTLQTDKFLPIFSVIENDDISDGMILGYMGSGGCSWASHGILDNGFGQPEQTPHETDGGTAWVSDEAIQEMLKVFKPNIIYYSMFNNSADDGFDEETYIQQAIQRMRNNLDATQGDTGYSANDVKIVVMTNYGAGPAPVWEERAYRVLNLAKSNNYSSIDLYHGVRDLGIVPTAFATAPNYWLVDSAHPTPQLSKVVAEFVWEQITNTALTGA